MPVIVKELIIKAKVDNGDPSSQRDVAGSGDSGAVNRTSLEEALDEVMRQIKNKNER